MKGVNLCFISFFLFNFSFSQTISTIVGNGTVNYSGDGGLATAAEIAVVTGVVVDSYRNIYIADEGDSRVRKVDPFGLISTFAGDGFPNYSGDDGPAIAAELISPWAVA